MDFISRRICPANRASLVLLAAACSLTVKHSRTPNEFITRMLYKDIY